MIGKERRPPAQKVDHGLVLHREDRRIEGRKDPETIP